MLFAHEPKTPATRGRHTIILLLLLIHSVVWIGASHAQDRQPHQNTAPIDFHIPAQTLPSALTQFATQARLFLVYQSELTQDHRTTAINGAYTPEQALGLLLHDTDLGFRMAQDNTVTIKRGLPRPRLLTVAATDSPAEPQSHVPTAADDEVETLPEVLVPGFKLTRDSYSAPNATTATKLDTPIMETPLSIQVVPPQTLKDQQAIQLGDAIKNVSGVLQGNTQGGFAEEFIIRGFNTGFNDYLDGFRFSSPRLSTVLAERIEVLKGAAANLYGRIEPGGMINVVLKRPKSTPQLSIEQQFGSYELYRTTGDATGPLTSDQTLQYRFNFENLDSQSFRDFVFNDRLVFSPALRWNASENTVIDLDYFYWDEKTVNDWTGIPTIGDRPADIPISRFLGEPTTDTSRTHLNHLGITVMHQFTDSWGVRGRFVRLDRDVTDRITLGNALNVGTGELSRGFFNSDANSNTYYGTVDVTGKFTTGPVKHRLLIGWDIYDQTSTASFVTTAVGSINIFNPIYGNSGGNVSTPKDSFFSAHNNWTGVYIQDQITLWDNLHILGGGRYDWATNRSGFVSGAGQSLASANANRQGINNDRFNPRVGVLYQPWTWLSLFGNYSESLGTPNTGVSAGGNAFDPQIAKQYEAGFKTELFEQRLSSSVAFFHLTKQNILTPIAGTGFSRAIGEARSQGVEIDVAGRVTDAFSLIATYAYTDTEITKGQNKGNRLFNAAKHIGSFWAKYDVPPKTTLEGLSVGAGVYLASKREGDAANTFQLPGYGRVDTFARYQFPFYETRMSLQLNIFNLFDKEYYESTTNDRFTTTPGAPRMFLGSIRIEY